MSHIFYRALQFNTCTHVLTKTNIRVDDSEKKLKLDKVGAKKMEELLQKYPELLERYRKEVFKEHIDIVGKYLQAIKQQEQ